MSQEQPRPERFLARFIATLKCRACGQAYDPNNAQVLGERDNALLIRLRCSRCGDENTVRLSQRAEDRPRAVRDLLPGEWRRFRDREPVSWDDVLTLHLFLCGFDGNFLRLFSTPTTA